MQREAHARQQAKHYVVLVVSFSRGRLRREDSKKPREDQLYTAEIMFSRLRDLIRRRANRNTPPRGTSSKRIRCSDEMQIPMLQALA